MLYTYPDYYKDFSCIADECEDTCCAGWKIVIDEKSLKRYKETKGPFGETLRNSINWKEATFLQDENKRCAFLNERNLCDLYLNQGLKGFCKTCREYPRHTEEFEGVREITLSISCPEVARIILNHKEPVTFYQEEKEGSEEYEDFDPFLFSIITDAREDMLAILQNRKLPLRNRVMHILGMANDIQGRINRQNMFDCYNVLEKYKKEKAYAYVDKYLQETMINVDIYALSKEWFTILNELEMLYPDWEIIRQETEDLLYGSKTKYDKCSKEFCAYAEENLELNLHLEQLLVYFLFTYLPGAVYDGKFYAKVQMAVYLVWMILEFLKARWIKNEKTLDMEELTEIVYRFSREVEHSDLNLEYVEKKMRKMKGTKK